MRIVIIILLAFLAVSCARIPKQKVYPPKQKLGQPYRFTDYIIRGDSLIIHLKNPIHCSARIGLRDDSVGLASLIKVEFPITLEPFEGDTLIKLLPQPPKDSSIWFTYLLGFQKEEVALKPLNWPFLKGKTYEIIQPYNGKVSHQSIFSKCALDFYMAAGDTICAVADGFVVGVIEGYKHGGFSQEWMDFANFVTLYHADINLFSHYLHIPFEGSFVEVGDTVAAGEPIALVGQTGFAGIPHLHFNTYRATAEGYESIPVEFEDGVLGKNLKMWDKVSRK
ncbi:MAG: M23 family metallopeptidase [Bacteroidota bacterium]